jgi:hypothetical protein
MNEDRYYIKISPEVIGGDIFKECYPSGQTYSSGCTYVYSGMSQILSGGTNGESLLSGLTIPILITENAVDVGFYSIFDGNLLQSDVVKNFVFSAQTTTPKRYYFYNTSDQKYKNYLKFSSFEVDWGDGVSGQTITTLSPSYIYHDYINNGTYTITLTQKNPWGVNTVKKSIVVPFTGTTIPNPNGTAYFTSNVGAWSATPISYDYIFTGDSENNVASQVSSNYTTTPFLITGNTQSRITELQSYGKNPYVLNKTIKDKNNQFFGIITAMTPTYTGYTIQDTQYLDFIDGTTSYLAYSSGLIPDWLVAEPIVKDESLINIVYQPEVQSDVYIERGKNSALERIERLGEVDNIGDLTNYGYGFFNFIKQENL